MKRLLVAYLSVMFLLPSLTTAGSQSKADKERAEKARVMAEQRKAKAEETRLKTDTKYFYEQKVKDKYTVSDGALVPFQSVSGEVLQITADSRILLSQKQPISGFKRTSGGIDAWNAQVNTTYKPAEPISVTMTNTQGLVNGAVIRLRVLPTGTYTYNRSDGEERTTREYKMVEPVTYEEYLALSKAGKGALPETK